MLVRNSATVAKPDGRTVVTVRQLMVTWHVRQPDIFVVPRQELERLVRDGNPVRELLFAIEVLSSSSGRYDRVTKRPGYQRHVPEYWIIDLESRLVERWSGDDYPLRLRSLDCCSGVKVFLIRIISVI
jgi:Uma2 family endonuclease